MRTLENLRSCHGYATSRGSEVEGLIDDYVSSVLEATRASPAMADRLRIEIMDHLTEAMEDLPGEPDKNPDLMQRAHLAINAFGKQERIGKEYCEVVAESHWRALRWTVLAGIGLTFATMRVRGYLFDSGWREDLMQSIWGSGIMFVDRYAFLVAILLVLAGLVLDRMRRLPDISAPRMSNKTVMRVLCIAAVPAVMVLMSALAGIGALLAPMLGNGGMRGLGLEWLAIATLIMFCSVLMRNLVILIRSCLPILHY